MSKKVRSGAGVPAAQLEECGPASSSGSPGSEDSTQTVTASARRRRAPKTHSHAVDIHYMEEQEAKAKKLGGPCYVCWETSETL